MDVRVIYHHEENYGWSFDSPDLPGLVGGAEAYEDARVAAVSAVAFHLECDAEETGRPVAEYSLEHLVPERSRSAFV